MTAWHDQYRSLSLFATRACTAAQQGIVAISEPALVSWCSPCRFHAPLFGLADIRISAIACSFGRLLALDRGFALGRAAEQIADAETKLKKVLVE